MIDHSFDGFHEAQDALQDHVDEGARGHFGIFWSRPSGRFFILKGRDSILAPIPGTDLQSAWLDDSHNDGRRTGWWGDAEKAQDALRRIDRR